MAAVLFFMLSFGPLVGQIYFLPWMWQAFKLTTTFSHLEDSMKRCPVVLTEMQPVMDN